MASFYLENFGCRATQADAAAIEQRLVEQGFHLAAPETADLVIVNTCTVTASADARARQAIRAFHRHNSRAQIIVTGCYAQRAPDEVADLEGVRWVIGNAHQKEIPQLVARQAAGASPNTFIPLDSLSNDLFSRALAPAKILTGNLFEQTTVGVAPIEPGAGGHTRPILKIQDGCNNRCAYCVIPQVRGRSRSLPPQAVIEEIRRLACAGAREVVLSGINMGSYGGDLAPRTSLGEIIGRILDETPVERLRLSSIEPMHLTADLIDRVAVTERVAPHFHVPLQSGSNRILAAMHRWYRAEHYERRIELIRDRLPQAAIGADVIAGFPGETETDHRATIEMVMRLPFTYLHVFSFSPRPGTEGMQLANPVEPEVIHRRARELRALAIKKAEAFRVRHVGRVARVLTLQTSHDDATDALTGNYITVGVPGRWAANQWLTVRLSDIGGPSLLGEPLDCAPRAATP